MGRKRQIGYGTSTSSQVRAVPVWNQPVDRRKLAQAILALVLAEADRTAKPTPDDDQGKEPTHE